MAQGIIIVSALGELMYDRTYKLARQNVWSPDPYHLPVSYGSTWPGNIEFQ